MLSSSIGRGCMVPVIIVLAVLMSTVRKQEQYCYSIQRASCDGFSLVGRLDGTFYEKGGGDVKAPYTLSIFISPHHDVPYAISNLVIYQDSSVPLLRIKNPPPLKREERSSDGCFQFVKIPDLDLQYKKCFVEFEVLKMGEPIEKVRLVFETEFSSRWTTLWWESMLSV